jgi:hypothetical protein
MIRSFAEEAKLPLTQDRLRLLCEGSLFLPPRERNALTDRLCQEMSQGHEIEVNEDILGVFSVILYRSLYQALDHYVQLEGQPYKFIEAIAIPVLLTQSNNYAPYKQTEQELEPKFNTLPVRLFLESKFPDDKFIVEERLLSEQRLVAIPAPDWIKHMQAIAKGEPSQGLEDVAQDAHKGPGTILRPRVVLAYRFTNDPQVIIANRIPEQEVIKAFNLAVDKVEFPASGGQGTVRPHAIGGFRPLHSALNHIRFYITMQVMEATGSQLKHRHENQPIEIIISRKSLLQSELYFKLTSNPDALSPKILHYMDPYALEAETKILFEFAQENGFSVRLEDEIPDHIEFQIQPLTAKGKRQWFRKQLDKLPGALKKHSLVTLLKHLQDRPDTTRKPITLTLKSPEGVKSYTHTTWEDILVDGINLLENNPETTAYEFVATNAEQQAAGLSLNLTTNRVLDPKELLSIAPATTLQIPIGSLLPKLKL